MKRTCISSRSSLMKKCRRDRTGHGNRVDTQKVAVLAALAIADELHSIQKDRGDREELMREQAERCLTPSSAP